VHRNSHGVGRHQQSFANETIGIQMFAGVGGLSNPKYSRTIPDE
jgi:hypothetical protein